MKAGLANEYQPMVLAAASWAEIIFGLLFLVPPASAWALRLTLGILPALLGIAAVTSTNWLITPFNVPTLTAAMLALTVLALAQGAELPTAGRCRRKPAHEEAGMQ